MKHAHECQTCKKIFKVYGKYRVPKFCSRKCFQIRIKPPETLEKMAAAKRGKDPWNKGKPMWDTRPHPKGTLGKPNKRKGCKLSEEHRQKLCFPKPKPTLRQIDFKCLQCSKEFTSKKACKSLIPKFCSRTCAGLHKRQNKKCPICQKHVSWVNSTFCSIECRSIARTGLKMSYASRKKMSLKKSGKKIGEKHWNWKGGVAEENLNKRRCFEYSNWRRNVFERDNFTCQICHKRGGELNADHILPFSIYPLLRHDLTNGRTLCVSCHKNTDTYGWKLRKKKTSYPDKAST
jgi:endogenous inhibitor of DNA gyrase (YacG/DUF329 family)